ncbi:MAG: hypothetical protein RLZZ502_1368 [Pseudomonadota bacterium]|jgi:NitT/TauT family transport system ATP-binding protein
MSIEFKAVSRRFTTRTSDVLAVNEVSFAIAAHEVVSIIGPSGCGKSTLLNMGAGLDKPTSGTVWVDGKEVLGPNPQVAFMLQKDLLMPWRNILDNVLLGLELRGADKSSSEKKALALMHKCRLAGFEKHYPHQLSGGMRQRAALARTLAVDPDVLLMDEPFSALDAQTKMILQQDLARTVMSEQKTMLFITHDLVEAVALSDRILVMSERPGSIIANILVDIPERANPMQRRQHPRVGALVGELMQLLHLNEATALH